MMVDLRFTITLKYYADNPKKFVMFFDFEINSAEYFIVI